MRALCFLRKILTASTVILQKFIYLCLYNYTIYSPHPTLGESAGMAAENLHNHCTDLLPKR